VTFILKILQKSTLSIIMLIFFFNEIELTAQLSTEKKNQLKQYTSLINDYKKQKKYRMVGFYLYKSASVYLSVGERLKAIDLYSQSAEYYDQIGSYSNKKKIYSNIAFVYAEMGQLKNAKKYYSKGLEISRRLNNRNDISASLMEVATIDIYIENYAKAQENLEEALKIANLLNDVLLLRTCYRLLSQLYKAYGNSKKSNQYYSNFLIYDKHVKDEKTIKRENQAEKIISAEKEKSQNLIEEQKIRALQYELSELINKREQDSLLFAISLTEDSLVKIEKQKEEIEKEKQKIELKNKVLQQDKKLKDLTIKQKNAEAAKQYLIIVSGAIGLILLIIIIVVAVFSIIQKRKANKQLEQQKLEIEIKRDQVKSKNDELEDAMGHIKFQNQNIMQSINYAQRIQDAMMPKQELMQTLFSESFIYFKPRDIVSGDFYWFKDTKPEINGVKNPANPIEDKGDKNKLAESRKFIVSAVDCTGHGVPGAFMSMLGFNLLNDIVGSGITESDKILGLLHKGIRVSLNQNDTENRDGMDMALCVIDPESKTLEYTGAQNPLIYIQDNKLYRVRGNKFPVGGVQVEHHDYTKHIINIDKPTTCYIFTDGFHDQFGGPMGRKFMTKNFRDLLYEIYHMPMDEQKNILDLVMKEWMRDYEQTDDILIIGFRLDFSNGQKKVEVLEGMKV